MRLLIVFAAGSLLVLGQPQATRVMLDRYCISCHNERLKSGDVLLRAADANAPEANPELWEKVVAKLSHRHMPPIGVPRPDEKTYNAVIASLTGELDRAAATRLNAGRTGTFRRLNRVEYHNAIRDILAVDYNVSSLLPNDETSHGFDNVTVENLTPTLLERYLSAAQKISRLAIGSPIRTPASDVILIPPDLTQEEHIAGLPFGTRGGTSISYHFPVSGQYELQIRLARDRNERVEGLDIAHRVELTVDGVRAGIFTVTPTPRSTDHQNVDKDLNVKIALTAGPHQIGAAFPRKTSALLETERQPYQAHFNMDRHPRIQPALYSISVLGPYEASGPGDSPSRRRIFVCQPSKPSDEQACAITILTNLLRRAYRRPVTTADLQMPLKFYRDARADGGFERGIEMALRALLVNPQFLFRIEKDPAGVASKSAYRIGDVELASRLSFFLWSTIPDDSLLDLAARGKLKDPVVLDQQVRRMLADPKADALTGNFATQWLYLRNLASTTPDPRLFPDFDENLRGAMQRETELFFESILREDRNVLDLLRADYTFLNERLARHYGIPNVYGSRFRRVALGDQRVRGGLLSQASILTVTSYSTRTSPVIRGKWILSNILGTPPAPPPPAVPQLKEAGPSVAGKTLTMRERVAEHRANPACAGCHNLMDPVGFAFENYDAVGRWRTMDAGVPVDASGAMPDGSKFANADELRQAMLRRPDLFVSTLTEKLLIYALGRGVEPFDAPAIRQIVRDAGRNNYRFSSLILGIVNSTPFAMRNSL
ncbi:MAG: DUF1592 domain-containing protein [Bryobacteraceae bacterium]